MQTNNKWWVKILNWMVRYAGSKHQLSPYNDYYTGPELFTDHRFPRLDAPKEKN